MALPTGSFGFKAASNMVRDVIELLVESDWNVLVGLVALNLAGVEWWASLHFTSAGFVSSNLYRMISLVLTSVAKSVRTLVSKIRSMLDVV